MPNKIYDQNALIYDQTTDTAPMAVLPHDSPLAAPATAEATQRRPLSELAKRAVGAVLLTGALTGGLVGVNALYEHTDAVQSAERNYDQQQPEQAAQDARTQAFLGSMQGH